MIIDDDEVNNFILIRLIKETGLSVICTSALNGQKAIKKLERWHKKGGIDFPDIILLDLEMPVMDGFSFLDLYEKSFYPHYPLVQLYMVSSSIRTEDRSRAKSYPSVSNFISKPLPIIALKEIIQQYRMTRAA
ncbi:MAG: response regulator [Bacteroidia bacterium]